MNHPIVASKVTKSNLAMMKSHQQYYSESNRSVSIDASSAHVSHNGGGQSNTKNNTSHTKVLDASRNGGRFKGLQQLSQPDSIHDEVLDEYTTTGASTGTGSNQTNNSHSEAPLLSSILATESERNSQCSTLDHPEDAKKISNGPQKRKMR